MDHNPNVSFLDLKCARCKFCTFSILRLFEAWLCPRLQHLAAVTRSRRPLACTNLPGLHHQPVPIGMSRELTPGLSCLDSPRKIPHPHLFISSPDHMLELTNSWMWMTAAPPTHRDLPPALQPFTCSHGHLEVPPIALAWLQNHLPLLTPSPVLPTFQSSVDPMLRIGGCNSDHSNHQAFNPIYTTCE
jgi:hypothetical protein